MICTRFSFCIWHWVTAAPQGTGVNPGRLMFAEERELRLLFKLFTGDSYDSYQHYPTYLRIEVILWNIQSMKTGEWVSQIQSLNAKDTKLFLSWLDLKSIADEEKQGEEGELNELIRTSTITTNREEDTTLPTPTPTPEKEKRKKDIYWGQLRKQQQNIVTVKTRARCCFLLSMFNVITLVFQRNLISPLHCLLLPSAHFR